MNYGGKFLSYVLFVFFLAGVTFVFTANVHAQGEIGCSGEIVKVANPEDDTLFDFSFFNGEIGQIISLSDPSNNVVPIALIPGEFLIVNEQITFGWVLESIDCESSGAVDLDIDDNGVTITCNGSGAMFQCEFNNILAPVEPAQVPTLSEWGLIVMALILGSVGFIVARRRVTA